MKCPECGHQFQTCPICSGTMTRDRQRILSDDRKAVYWSCGCGAEVRIKHPRYEEVSRGE